MTENERLNVLHSIHDFLPRHQAGSEIYALELCREQQKRNHASVLCADYDPTTRHGSVRWRLQDGLPIVELVNNWDYASFVHTYRSPLIRRRVEQVLQAVQPDVVHVHNLLNLSFDLPALARARGIPVVATLHDYTLVCPSGGQRIHRAENHICHEIDVVRCARCFAESPFSTQMAMGRMAGATGHTSILPRLARAARRILPSALVRRAADAVGQVTVPEVTAQDISERLDAARGVFDQVSLFVAPSPSIAREYEQLGVDPDKLVVSDYGFRPLSRPLAPVRTGPLRIGYVGSLVWHKGVHVLLHAAASFPSTGWTLGVYGNPAVDPDYVARLRTAAAGLPVRFHGAFGRDDTSEVFSQIDLLVVPSLWLENSPLVIHEAFMAGVPVVGSRIGGVADLIHDGVDGVLYDPSSTAALSTVVGSLVDNPARVRTMATQTPPVKTIEQDATEWEEIYRCYRSSSRP